MAVYESVEVYASGKPFSAIERTGPNATVLRSWLEDGTLIFEISRTESREKHGRYRSWWNDGVLKEEGTFHYGKRTGMYRWYLPSGALWKEHDYGAVP